MRFRLGVLLSITGMCAVLSGCDDSAAAKAKSEKPKSVKPGAVDADAPEEFTTTESGLKYRIRRKSTGKKPTDRQLVTVHYRGWLDDGTIFDTSYGTGGTEKTFDLRYVIPAWTEGMQLIGEGGMIEFEVPPALGYGEKGQPPYIPPNSTLHFIVELYTVADPTAPDSATMKPGPGPGKGLEPGSIDSDAPEEFTTTETGLKYRIRRRGKGPKAKKTGFVNVHYRGWLDSGKVFDTSYDTGQPAEFGLSQVIPGWTEGLQLVSEGGMIELEIPPALGYGAAGHPPEIPPNSTLHFLIEVLTVK